MDYDAYRRAYFTQPQPEPRFSFVGFNGVTLYIEAYEAGVDFYTHVLGPPAYAEGQWTRGWPLGKDWLTLLKGQQGGPANMEMSILLESAAAVETLYTAFVQAGATGVPPSDQLMYEPIYSAMVIDPFGTTILLISRNNPE